MLLNYTTRVTLEVREIMFKIISKLKKCLHSRLISFEQT